MNNNEKKLDLKKDKENKFSLRRNKIYIIGGVCFLMGFILAPNGISEADHLNEVEKAENKLEKIENELDDSKQLIDNLENKLKQAQIFLDLDEDNREIIIDNINEINIKKEEERKAKQLEEEKKKAEELEKQMAEEKAKEARVTKLYKDIYENFAPNVGSSLYSGVLYVVESSGYKYKVTEPTEDVMGKIEVYDNSSRDSVSLIFYPKNEIEVLSLVQYNRGEKAVAASTDLHISPLSYSIYDGKNKDVYSMEDQREFIFAE